jgi:hypothetical protein
MTLNKLAGRSYNDLSQYPVLPWIFSPEGLSTTDFAYNNKLFFRNLRKNMGTLVSRLNDFIGITIKT